jgi:hypothetical protein
MQAMQRSLQALLASIATATSRPDCPILDDLAGSADSPRSSCH